MDTLPPLPLRRFYKRLTLLLFALLAATPAFAGYSFSILGVLNNQNYSVAEKINNGDQILGSSGYSDGPGYTALWEDNQITNITALANLPGPYDSIYLRNLNNSGTLVGSLYKAECDFCSVAVKWENGSLIELGSLGMDASPTAINDFGAIVGASNIGNTPGTGHATLWSNGSITNLGTLGGANSIAQDINNAGAVIGYSKISNSSDYTHATLWRNGVIQDLGTLGGDYSYAAAINEQNQIVGNSRTGNGEYHAALWDNGVLSDLGGLDNGYFSNAVAINEAGLAVGYASDDSEFSKATLWINGGITDLNTFLSGQNKADGWVLTHALDINDKGWIVGQAFNTISGETQAFLLAAAVPELGNALMLLLGLALLAATVYRNKNGMTISAAS